MYYHGCQSGAGHSHIIVTWVRVVPFVAGLKKNQIWVPLRRFSFKTFKTFSDVAFTPGVYPRGLPQGFTPGVYPRGYVGVIPLGIY